MYQIILDKDDYLRLFLFTATKSKRIRNRRKVSWISCTVIFLLPGIMKYLRGDTDLTTLYFISAAICFVLIPFLERWRYRKHYETHVEDNYKESMGLVTEVRFEDEVIVSKDAKGESEFELTEIEMINEIRDNLFIKMKSGLCLIISKRFKEYPDFKKQLIGFIKSSELKWNEELDWKWR